MSSDNNSTSVEYAKVDWCPGYRFGSDGSIWSCWNRTGRMGVVYRERKPSINQDGYKRIYITVNKKKVNILVHRLVLEAFCGPCPDGFQGCHNDGNRTNNQIGNLRWDTFASNTRDKVIHGTCRGMKNPKAKLCDADIRTIRRLYNTGATKRSLARMFDVTETSIWKIVYRHQWKHVD
jgi:hypothetical protein